MPSIVLAIVWLLVIVVAFGGLVFVTWWALFADRPRGRRRCPHCWHDMTYTPGFICGECGCDGGTEKALGRTRRRKIVAITGLLMSVALAAYIADRARARGWTGVPTPVLLTVVPWTGDPGHPSANEMRRRANIGRFDRDDWKAAIECAARGDRRARPTSASWRLKYAPVLRSAKRRLPRMGPKTTQVVTTALLDTPAWLRFDAPSPWPAGEPVSAHVYAESWWPDGVACRITAAPALEGAETDVHVLLDTPIQLRSYSLELPPFAPGRHVVPIDVKIERRLQANAEWQVMRSERMSLALEVAELDGPEPIHDEDLDELVYAAFSPGVVYSSQGSLPVRIMIDRPTTLSTAFDDVTIGAELELWRNGELGRRLDTWWRAGTNPTPDGNAWEVPMWSPAVLSPAPTELDQWEIRVRGSRRLALRVPGTSRYWAGEVRIPVEVRRQSNNATPRGWLASDDPALTDPPTPTE